MKQIGIVLGLMAASAFGADLECTGEMRVPQTLSLDLDQAACLDGTAVLNTMEGEVVFNVKKVAEKPGITVSSVEYQLFADNQPETKLVVTKSEIVGRGGRAGGQGFTFTSAKLTQPNQSIHFSCHETNL